MITRQDLTFGQQASQLCHAMRQFVHDHPSLDNEWFNNSNYICLLSVDSESELHKLVCLANERDIACSKFQEPDLENVLTAICLAPGPMTKKMVSGLKLAFRSET